VAGGLYDNATRKREEKCREEITGREATSAFAQKRGGTLSSFFLSSSPTPDGKRSPYLIITQDPTSAPQKRDNQGKNLTKENPHEEAG